MYRDEFSLTPWRFGEELPGTLHGGTLFLGCVLFCVKKNEPGFGAETHANRFDYICSFNFSVTFCMDKK